MKNKTLITIGIAESVSAIGDWITMMSVFALLVFRGDGGVAQSSGIFLAGLLPTLPASLAAGWLCDRFDRKTLMIGSLILSGLIVSGLIFTENLVLIYLLLALQAVSVSLMTPARASILPDILPADELTRANAFLQQLSSLVKIGAPILAGALLAVLNPHQAIILDVVSFFLAAALLTHLPRLAPKKSPSVPIVDPRETASPKPANTASSLLRGNSRLQLVYITGFLCILVLISFDVLCAVYFRDVLHTGEQYMGFAIGLVGVGTLISTILLMRKNRRTDPWRDVITGIILLGIIPAALAMGNLIRNITTLQILVLTACLLGGVGNGFVHVQMVTLLQTLAPSGMIGRASGLFQSVAVAGQLVGLLLTPLLVPGLLDMSNFFLVAAACLAGVILVITVQLNRTRPATSIIPEASFGEPRMG
jgi:MFS family permease